MPRRQMPRQRMPAEWEPHAATWLAWPTSREDWPRDLVEAESEFVELVAALAASERTEILAGDIARARERLGPTAEHPNVRLHAVPTREPYVRDTGPTFVLDSSGEPLALDWRFDAWGGRYAAARADDAVASTIARLAGVAEERVDLVLEGGAIDVDGEGTLLATRSSLLDPVRNPGLDETELKRVLEDRLGIERVLWLEGELAGDDTDSHIDNLARFVAPGRVASVSGVEGLQGARDARGRALEIVELPTPPPLDDARDLPASYANFYVANRAVLVPVFDVDTDTAALRIVSGLFPDRRVTPIPIRTLIRGLGGIHCLCQPQPG